MSNTQLLHIVIGGELTDVQKCEFRDLSKLDYVGAYATYDEAVRVWKAKAQSTVDNALMRYFVIDAHKLLSPAGESKA